MTMRFSLTSLRALLFRVHWALGLSAGLVLALMGVTGALMSYDEALIAWANWDRTTVAAGAGPTLSPEALVARVEAQSPGLRVRSMALSRDPTVSVRVHFLDRPRGGGRPVSVYVDPYDGAVLGHARLEGVIWTIRGLHRWLLIPGEGKGWGRTITSSCALALIAFLMTGIYLRWPQIHSWRVWLQPKPSRPGRARWWSLHAVAGTWVMPIYAVIVLSGLWWSFDAYRAGATWLLTGESPRMRSGAGPRDGAVATPPPALDRMWTAFQAGEGRAATLSILTLPNELDGRAIRVRWFAHGAADLRASHEARFDPTSGAPLASERFADKPLGRQMADAMLEVHRGSFFGAAFALLFFLAALAMPGFLATGLTLYVLRRRAGSRRRLAVGDPVSL